MKLAKRLVFGWISLCMITRCTGDNERCVASMGGGCPPTWRQWGDKCYKATQELQWSAVKQECIKMGGVMVVPQSEEETAFLMTLLSRFWIDCNDLQNEGVWECNGVTTEVHNMNWDQDQPDDYRLSQNCGVVWLSNGKWHDAPCDYKLRAICKRPTAQLHF